MWRAMLPGSLTGHMSRTNTRVACNLGPFECLRPWATALEDDSKLSSFGPLEAREWMRATPLSISSSTLVVRREGLQGWQLRHRLESALTRRIWSTPYTLETWWFRPAE